VKQVTFPARRIWENFPAGERDSNFRAGHQSQNGEGAGAGFPMVSAAARDEVIE